MFDRSMFFDELKQNPDLLRRLNTIVNGEIGRNASPEARIKYLETVFNRATARGQSIDQVTREYSDPNDSRFPKTQVASGKDGYYPASTFRNGAPQSQNEANRFNEQVLKPVLGGSDTLTADPQIGFPATGNASAGVAARGVANGKYTRHATPGGRAGDPGRETYVQEGRLDNVDRLNQYASGGTIPRPPADIPTAGNMPPQPSGIFAKRGADVTDRLYAGMPEQQRVTASLIHNNPGYRPPDYATIESGGAVPLPRPRGPIAPPPGATPPPSAMPSPQNRIVPGRGLGDAMAAMGGYVDPNTGHQIINPSGSGEMAMGLTRDIGPLSRQTPARPAPAPVPRPAPSPPGERAGNPPQRGPVPPDNLLLDETQRGSIAPSRPPLSLAPEVFNVKPAQDWTIGLTGGKEASPSWLAPPEAGALAAPSPPPSPPQQQTLNLAPWGSSTGGSELPLLPPTTVSEQMTGRSAFDPKPQQPQFMALSPLATGRQQQPNEFASTTLLPFQQWPPPGWDWGGGGGFAGWGPSSFDFGAFG